MTYVDDVIDWGEIAVSKGLRWTKWCHLIADTHEELVDMASKLHLRYGWIQEAGTTDEHFDLIPTKRILAIKYGAKAISCVRLGEIIISKRRNRTIG